MKRLFCSLYRPRLQQHNPAAGEHLVTWGCAGFTRPEAVTEVDVSRALPAQGVARVLQSFQKLFERTQGDPFYAVIAYRSFKPIYD